MFTHVGKKLQFLGKILAWIGIVASLIIAGLLIYGGLNTYDYLMIISGAIVLVLMPLIIYAYCLVLIGFGKIVSSTREIKDDVKSIKHKLKEDEQKH